MKLLPRRFQRCGNSFICNAALAAEKCRYSASPAPATHSHQFRQTCLGNRFNPPPKGGSGKHGGSCAMAILRQLRRSPTSRRLGVTRWLSTIHPLSVAWLEVANYLIGMSVCFENHPMLGVEPQNILTDGMYLVIPPVGAVRAKTSKRQFNTSAT